MSGPTKVVSKGQRVPAIVIMGQSNGYRMYFYGDVAMRTTGNKYVSNPIYINCAVSGTGLYQQMPGTDIYKACLAQIKAAGADPVAYIWWQGEFEAQGMRSIADVDAWASNWRIIMNQLETDTQSHGAKIAVARIALLTPEEHIDGDQIRSEQESLADTAHVVNVDDLQGNFPADGHYPSESYNAAADRLITAAFN